MSFFSDLAEGKFSNLVTDITHAPDSLSRHPAEIGETAAAVIAALSLGTLSPEAFGLAGGAEVGAEALGAADLGAAAADTGLAADLGIADIAGAAGAADAASGLTAIAPDTLDFLLPAAASDLAPFGDALAFAPDAISGAGDVGSLAPFSDLAPSADLTAANEAFGTFDPASFTADAGLAPSATPSGFAPTDAELSGGQTGTVPSGATGGAGATSGGGTATGGGGIWDTLKGVASSPWTRLAAGAAPLGLALLRGEPQLPSSAVAAQQNAAALSQFGQQQLAMGQAGQLNAGQMALLQKMRDDLTNQMRQALYNQGVTNPAADTRWAQMEAYIDTQVTAQTATMIQQEIQNGLTALNTAGTELNQIAQMQMTADQNFTNTLVNATKALAFALPGSRPSVNIGSGLALSAAA